MFIFSDKDGTCLLVPERVWHRVTVAPVFNLTQAHYHHGYEALHVEQGEKLRLKLLQNIKYMELSSGMQIL